MITSILSWGRDDFSTSVEHEALNVNWVSGDDGTVAPTFNDSQGKLYAGNNADWYLAFLRSQHDIEIYDDVELNDFRLSCRLNRNGRGWA